MMLDIVESRYDRQERISWWDQARLRAARVLVIGAGALGNEIVKNLALVGVGGIDIVDMDAIEHTNLARCALFRDADAGRWKAEALAEAAMRLNPDVTARSFVCTVQELGSAWLDDYDVVLAGLDSREARLWVNAACRRLGKPWIDGAIEGLQGIVRMFDAQGACYDCTLGEAERAVISHRRSCALLSPEEIVSGRTPTNATTASVVAALEVQEAIKLIVGREDLLALRGKVWRLDGETMFTTTMDYVEDPDCMSHDVIEERMSPAADAPTLAEALRAVAEAYGGPIEVIYTSDDVIVIEPCAACGAGEEVVSLRPMLGLGAGLCGTCGAELPMTSRTALSADDSLISAPWERWQWPRAEFITCLVGGRYVAVRMEAAK